MKISIKPNFNALSCLLFSLLISTLLLSLYSSMALASTAVNTDATPPVQTFDLMMVGGGLVTCSSLSRQNCVLGSQFTADAKQTSVYRLTQSALERAFKHPSLSGLTAPQKAILLHASQQQGNAGSSLSYQAFYDAISAVEKDFLTDLNDQVYYALLDLLEDEQAITSGINRQEHVMLSATQNQYGAQIFSLFTQQALLKKQQRQPQAKRPLIAVVTASARDPFESIDFYTQVFEQAGADVIWLPLDSALQAAIAQQQCDQLPALREKIQGNVDRARLYPVATALQQSMCVSPDSLYQQLLNIDGLFLNGGDQRLTLSAWLTPQKKPSKALDIIKKRLQQHQIVIGGTSAGTAVMTAQYMVTGGTSHGALTYGVLAAEAPSERCEESHCQSDIPATAVTYSTTGGLGFFPFGVTDTHFSQRERQVRLFMLSALSENKLGFGVDENTALLVDLRNHTVSVVGEHGVWVVEQSHVTQTPLSYSGVMHYLTAGDNAKVDVVTQSLNHIQLLSADKTISKQADVKREFNAWVDKACVDGQNDIDLGQAKLIIKPQSQQECDQIKRNGQHYQNINIQLNLVNH